MEIYPWQHSAWNDLLNYYRSDNLPHALILSGGEGIGKFDLACIFANALLCTAFKKDACLTCRSCELFASNNHPDFYTITVEKGSDVIKIDQIRRLVEQLAQTPKISMRQVVVIRAAEKMNIAAANALLKTLEEPKGEVVFLLTSSKLHQLPATIRSRCQLQSCVTDNDEAGLKWLLMQIPDEPTAKLLWHVSNKSPLFARDLFEASYLKVRDVILQGMYDIYKKNKSPVDIAKVVSAFDTMLILQSWMSLMIDLWQMKWDITLNSLTNQDQFKTIAVFAPLFEVKAIERFHHLLLEAINAEQSQFNLNKVLLLDNLWIQFSCYITARKGS
jgi:DNA polymerase-3 subunit delta'